MMQTMTKIIFDNVHLKNVHTLIEKINTSEAILVGAAAGMSISCGYNFFIKTIKFFRSIWVTFIKSMALLEHLMDSIIITRPRKPIGLF